MNFLIFYSSNRPYLQLKSAVENFLMEQLHRLVKTEESDMLNGCLWTPST